MSGVWPEDEKGISMMSRGQKMSLNKALLAPRDSVYQDAEGKALPLKKWATHLYYVLGCQAHQEDVEVFTNKLV